MKAAKKEAWNIYVEPKIATEEKFKSLKEIFIEYLQKYLLRRKWKNQQHQRGNSTKKTHNIDQLNELLGPSIYLNGGRKEQGTEKWSMAAKFNEKDYFTIFFTDETKKGGDKVECRILK